jgi:hypothetical protein
MESPGQRQEQNAATYLVLASSDLLKCVFRYLDLDPIIGSLTGAAALVCRRWHRLVGTLVQEQRRQRQLRFRERYAARASARSALSTKEMAVLDALLSSKLLPVTRLRLPEVVALLERGASCELMVSTMNGNNLCN